MGEQTAAMDPVQGYEERLEALLQQCAEDFQTRPDAFLWNCRRCLECVAYAQLSSQQQNYQPGSREGELSNFAGKLPRKLQDEWRFVVGKSNLAVHVTGPVVGDLFEDARTCKEQLDKIVRWYFDPDNTRADRLPPGIASSLDQLRRGGVPKLDLPRELEAKQREIEQQLQRQFQQEREVLLHQLRDAQVQGTRAGTLEASLLEERTRRAQLERNILTLDDELRVAREKLAEREPMQSSTPTPPPAVIFAAKNSRKFFDKRDWIRRGLVATGGLALVLLFLFFQASSSRGSAPALSVAPVVSGAVLQASVTVAQQEPSPALPSPSAAVSDQPQVPLQCPEGMIRIGKNKHHVVPPTRSWTRNSPSPSGGAEVDVEPFCIDPKLVSSSEYRGSQSGVSRRSSSQPILSRTHEEASRFCRTVRRGRLPTVAERELAIHVKGLEIHNRTGEWSEDAFPASVFQLGPVQEQCKGKPERCFMLFAPQVEHIPDGDTSAQALDPGWNRELGSARRADIGFRCVFTGT